MIPRHHVTASNIHCIGLKRHTRTIWNLKIAFKSRHQTSMLSYLQSRLEDHLNSNHLNSGNVSAENANESSCPTFAPWAPISLAMGPLNHSTFMPIAAPKNPKQNAPIADQPKLNSAGSFHASKLYEDHRHFRKKMCSSATTTMWITVQYPMMLRKVWSELAKERDARDPTMMAMI